MLCTSREEHTHANAARTGPRDEGVRRYVPEAACSPGVLVYCMVEAVVGASETPREDGAEPAPSAFSTLLRYASNDPASAEAILAGDFGASDVCWDHHDAAGLRIARSELELAGLADDEPRLGSKLLLALDRAAHRHMQTPRLLGGEALPPIDARGPAKRGVARTELQAFTAFSPHDVDAYGPAAREFADGCPAARTREARAPRSIDPARAGTASATRLKPY